MLTSIYEALIGLFSSLPFPVYLADCVPEGAEFPYITAQIEAPLTPSATGSLTLTAWCSGSTANSKRLSIINVMPPAEGVWLATTTGALVLRQADPVKSVQDASLLGMQSRWKLRFFPSV